MQESIQAYLGRKRLEIESALDAYLPVQQTYPEVITEAMRYSLFANGKRLRPILTLAVTETLGQAAAIAMPYACGLEMIHTYSLIHDDLPCMDDDDYRRGKLTNHKVYGEAIAVLAGDALLTLAFDIMTRDIPSGHESIALQIIQEVSKAAGARGMIGGQVADILNEGQQPDKSMLSFIHAHKTGALLTAAVRIGALAGQADQAILDALTTYAEKLGLAFQIVDDILDVVGEAEKLGKAVGADTALEKMTYPKVYGIEESKRMVQELTDEAMTALALVPHDTTYLREIALYLLKRDH
jgi:geranylgeranyl diphosphate synthase, type II